MSWTPAQRGLGKSWNSLALLFVCRGQPFRLPVSHTRVPSQEVGLVMDITRKQFCDALAGGSALLLLGGCGGGGSYGSSGGTTGTSTSSCSPTIDSNHGHALPIAVADLDSATSMTYDILGMADHSHSVTLGPALLQLLKTGAPVTVASTLSVASATTAPHTHNISISCVIY